jgi:hypothetical protein
MSAATESSVHYREDMDPVRCDDPNCTSCVDVLHIHSYCDHGDRYLEFMCDHRRHLLAIACEVCAQAFWYWRLAKHGKPRGDEPDTVPPTWGWADWDKLSEGYEATSLRVCHPEETQITYIKALGVIEVRCLRGCKHSNGFLRHAIASRG